MWKRSAPNWKNAELGGGVLRLHGDHGVAAVDGHDRADGARSDGLVLVEGVLQRGDVRGPRREPDAAEERADGLVADDGRVGRLGSELGRSSAEAVHVAHAVYVPAGFETDDGVADGLATNRSTWTGTTNGLEYVFIRTNPLSLAAENRTRESVKSSKS